jgi:hypothetical protein
MRKLALDVLPKESVESHATTVSPIANTLSAGGAQLTVGSASMSSVAVTA